MKQFYKNNTLNFILAAAATTSIGLLNLPVSLLMKEVMDLISDAPGHKSLRELTCAALLIVLAIVLIQIVSYLTKPRFIRRAMTQYKDHVFSRLTEKSIASFRTEPTTRYISALSNDATTIEQDYLETSFELIQNALVFAGALGMMILLSPQLTLAAAALSVLPVIASLLAGNRMVEAERQVSERNRSFLETLTDALTGFTVVKSFKAEREILELFQRSNDAAEGAKAKKREIATIIGTIGAIAGFAAQIGVFLIGAWLAITGERVTAGTVLVFVNLMNFIIQPIADVPGLLAKRRGATALIEKLDGSLNENVREEGREIVPELKRGIQLKDVSFSYTPGQRALKDLNFNFAAGKSYAIVGASGSGKSTLLNTLLASNSDYAGHISYDGVELRDISTESLYDLVSVIQQNVFIFNAPVRENITMFRHFPSDEVDRVIELAGLGEFIEQKGQDYLCGENGNHLSGGEKQRVSIARALLRESSLLLVDEATAALDARTAKQVSNSILDLRDMTRIVVTHALDADLLRRYDCIVVLKDGAIVESGDFETLMKQGNYFHSLYTVAA